MKVNVIRGFLAAALLVTAVGAAHAQDVTVSFKGTITHVDNSPFPITVAQTFTGYYTYNLATPNTGPFPQVAYYTHVGEPYGIAVTIGTRTFKTDPANGFGVYLNDGFVQPQPRDSYTVSSFHPQWVDGINVSWIIWSLVDYTQTALTSVALPSTAPTLS